MDGEHGLQMCCIKAVTQEGICSEELSAQAMKVMSVSLFMGVRTDVRSCSAERKQSNGAHQSIKIPILLTTIMFLYENQQIANSSHN